MCVCACTCVYACVYIRHVIVINRDLKLHKLVCSRWFAHHYSHSPTIIHIHPPLFTFTSHYSHSPAIIHIHIHPPLFTLSTHFLQYLHLVIHMQAHGWVHRMTPENRGLQMCPACVYTYIHEVEGNICLSFSPCSPGLA